MYDWLETYAQHDSPLHRWEPRAKMVALLALMFAFALVEDVRLLPAMLLVTALFYRLSGLPLAFALRRLRYPAMFLLVVALIVPFTAGQSVLLQVGPLALHREGLTLLALMLTRFVCILTIGLLLFATGPFLAQVGAMRALGLPATLADMLLFFYRYLHDTAANLATMQTAMRLRGFHAQRLSRRNLAALAALAGSLLVRSYEQSRRVYQAMRLRGYGHAPPTSAMFAPYSRHALALYATLALAAAFVAATILLQWEL